jgi:broad specificity phosphatase PhoE
MTPEAVETPTTVDSTTTSFTIYLIRHGEAVHNTKEKVAMERARQAAISEGLDPEGVTQRVELARVAILNDESLFDCPLSQKGKEEAESARQAILDLQASGLPAPTYVLVSPLQRALQTANHAFPDCDEIHVRDQLKERQTGKACDTREHTKSLAMRGSFQRFSMARLRASSLTKTMHEELKSWLETDDPDDEDNEFGIFQYQRTDDGVEGKPMLRARTKKLFELLVDSGHQVLAVISHKGYLRELEQGPLGQEKATEFSNCEVRVYNATFTAKSYILEAAERVA